MTPVAILRFAPALKPVPGIDTGVIFYDAIIFPNRWQAFIERRIGGSTSVAVNFPKCEFCRPHVYVTRRIATNALPTSARLRQALVNDSPATSSDPGRKVDIHRCHQHMVDLTGQRQKETGVQLLWVTAYLFSHRRCVNGAAANPEFDVIAHVGAQVKAAIDATIALGGKNYVF